MSTLEAAAVEGVSDFTIRQDTKGVRDFSNDSTRTDSLGREQPTRLA